MPFPRGKKPATMIPALLGRGTENQEEGPHVKRSSSPPRGAPKKRTAFIDITNAHKVHLALPGRKKEAGKKTQKKTAVPSTKNQANLKKSVSSVSSIEEVRKEEERKREEERKEEAEERKEEEEAGETTPPPVAEPGVTPPSEEAAPRTELPPHLQRPQIPEEFDIDSQHEHDVSLTAEYAREIFDYLKRREDKFVLVDYMSQQPSLNPNMRAVLVDWLVEVQENFELNHETLYLAVKLTDHYLALTPVSSSSLQLIGSTALLIASKFEECSPPCVDDFQYICDDAYKREELISMEQSILQTLDFDINIPVPYRFLRRYAKCVGAGMDTLTLARFVCELSLQEMDLVSERASLLASACLLLALVTKELGGWSPILQYHSGYSPAELAPVVRRLHSMLSAPQDDKLRSVRSKYAHKVFFEVATIPVVAIETLEKALLAQ